MLRLPGSSAMQILHLTVQTRRFRVFPTQTHSMDAWAESTIINAVLVPSRASTCGCKSQCKPPVFVVSKPSAIVRPSHHRIESNGCGFTEAKLYVEQSHLYVVVGKRGYMAYHSRICPYAEATFNQSNARVQPCQPTGISHVRTSRTVQYDGDLLGVSASSLNLGGAQRD
jgi:hypothetical protein